MIYAFEPTFVKGKMHKKPDNEECVYEGNISDLKKMLNLLEDKDKVLVKDQDGLYWYFYVR